MCNSHLIMPIITVQKITIQQDLEIAFAIRNQVFVIEQNCPAHLEFENEEVSRHFLAYVDDQPAGVCRWRQTPNGYKCERFAVLKQFRSLSVGSHLMETLLANLPQNSTYIYLHAQITAMGLYKKFGFVAEGQMFDEAGIQHYKMVLKIS